MSIAAKAQAQAEVVPVGLEVTQAQPQMVRSEHGRGQAPFALPTAEAQDVSLPLLATGGDVREVIKALKKRPGGITIVHAMNSDQRRLFDERKIAAYKFWGLIEYNEERLRLTSFGQEFARQLEQETTAYRTLLSRVEPYCAALKWIHDEGLELVSFDLIAALWQRLYPASLDLYDNYTAKGNVVCFFHLCQSADLGIVTIGKRGQPARIRVARAELTAWVALAETAKKFPPAARPEEVQTLIRAPLAERRLSLNTRQPHADNCIFISHRQQHELVGQVQEILRLMDARSIVIQRDDTTAHRVAQQTLAALRECQAAIMIISAEELQRTEVGQFVLDEQLRLELGAACALYDQQIILVWQSSNPLPDDLRDLHHCCLAGHDLTLENGLHFMQLIKIITMLGRQ